MHPPERVYRAFTTADALVKWMAPHGVTVHVELLEVKPEGKYRMYFTNFSTGTRIGFGGTYHEVIPNALLRYTDQFEDPNMPDLIEVKVEFKAVSVGTEIQITQSGIPDVIPVEACYLGWQESLQLLTLLITAEIPDS